MSFKSLPLELVREVVSYAGQSDLASLSRLSKPFLDATTPYLYERVTLRDVRSIHSCCRTLTSSSAVALKVRFFTMNVADREEEVDPRLLEKAIYAMEHLHSFASDVEGALTAEICIALCRNTSLEYVYFKVSLRHSDDQPHPRDIRAAMDACPPSRIRSLQICAIKQVVFAMDWDPAWFEFLRRVLNSPSLELLDIEAFASPPDEFAALFVSGPIKSITTLRLPRPTKAWLYLCYRMPNLSVLEFRHLDPMTIVTLNGFVSLPNVTHIAWHSSCVPFMATTCPRVEVLRLDRAMFAWDRDLYPSSLTRSRLRLSPAQIPQLPSDRLEETLQGLATWSDCLRTLALYLSLVNLSLVSTPYDIGVFAFKALQTVIISYAGSPSNAVSLLS